MSGTEPRYRWWGWAAETELDNDDDREGVYFLTIADGGEEMAVVVHRTVGGKYPLDGEVANAKVARAQRMVDALNATVEAGVKVEKPAAPEVIVMRVFDEDDDQWSYDVVVCPHEGCLSRDFYEVDEATRWNPMDLNDEKQYATSQILDHWEEGRPVYNLVPNPLVDLPMFLVSEGKNGDGYSTARHICQDCISEVTIPEWLETQWV